LNGGQGPVGGVGAAGVQGLPGQAGAQGIAGVEGATGLQGSMGDAGVSGATGASGVAGATGATGSAGMVYRGAYGAGTNYAVGDVVTFAGASWVSVAGGNAGQEPDVSPASWSVVAAQGAAGLQGVPGVAGPAGSTGGAGAQGVQGVVGAQGVAGPQGPAGSQGLAGSQGAVGAAGVAGLQGMAGQAGAQGVAGAVGAVGAQGAQGSAGSNGVAGAAGGVGATGANGAVGMNFRSAWSPSTNYAVNDAVTYSGGLYLALAANKNAEPDANASAWSVVAQAGGQGPTGAAGTSATVAVGTVTTLAAGAQATVTNAGTAGATVLNFGIPQGAMGAAGSGGSGASAAVGSGSFAGVVHMVSFASNYYAVNSTNASAGTNQIGTSATTVVLAWVPLGCTATQLNVYSQQSNTIAVTLQVGSPGAMVNSAMSCVVATNSSCVTTGAVVVGPGQFVDYVVTGSPTGSPSGTAAPVWTSLQCQ
jgi:collagen type VII alpha